MTTERYETGNTVRFSAVIKDRDQTTLINPATVTVYLYNADEDEIGTDAAVYSGTIGNYYYDWTLPSEAGTYYIEFNGDVGGDPSLNRTPVKVKFNT